MSPRDRGTSPGGRPLLWWGRSTVPVRPALPAAAFAAAALAAAGCSSPPGGAPPASDAATPRDGAPADAPAPDAAAGTPDLIVHAGRATADLTVTTRVFAPDACELNVEEDCVLAPGTRRLLHFAVETPNVGDGDLVLGEPQPDNPNLMYSECHGHYHFEGYAAYRLIDAGGAEVAVGRKQAFCLLDSSRWITDDPTVPVTARYHCEYQGIQRGWADVYHTRLPCQFIDVTGVPDGSYTLEIELNQERALEELDYDNNRAVIPIELGASELETPTEPCPEDLDDRASAGLHRECGWQLAATFDCPAGTTTQVGCADQCGLGSCTGDPMIRVCDAAEGNCSYPASAEVGESDDHQGACPCDLSVKCPASGQIAVYTAPKRVGAAYQCEPAIAAP